MARERKFSTNDLFAAVKHILIQHGYEGFTFSLLSERLEVSRGAIYKYYQNKENLITDFMVREMQLFIADLQKIEEQTGFESQFDFLLDIIFKKKEVHQLIGVAQHILASPNEEIYENKEKLKKIPLEMYQSLQGFIRLGKIEGKVKPHLPDSLLLGMILQTIAIPNHFRIPEAEWVGSIKEIISQGMFTKS
ncbi:TetR/AcrR family transcriptional regulator [Peribacillus deserti]|uniref:TetR/AcrR family transcriptional regulator n=1 Tax=Peribacillus deserti TaxID=673318 RepID=A0A2N5M5P8_9BACI|nr:TetR/AcrR family transcriptional regulator [Peribacillus deserti]PLT29688.1 TetR/AcrR family transcriptional regulator [Peribacillus deserti]